MSKFDDWYHGPEDVKQVVGYKSAKIAWDYQQKRIEELEAQVAALTADLAMQIAALKDASKALTERQAKVAALEGEVLDLKAVDEMRCIGLENKRIRINKQNACIEELEAQIAALQAKNDLLTFEPVVSKLQAQVARLQGKLAAHANQVAALEAALAEAIEWNWITDSQDIPDYVVSEIDSALAGSGYECAQSALKQEDKT